MNIILLFVLLVSVIYDVSQAFGTGALDEENEEEEDVYGVEAITSYDSTLASERDLAEERKFGWTGGLQDGKQATGEVEEVHWFLCVVCSSIFLAALLPLSHIFSSHPQRAHL